MLLTRKKTLLGGYWQLRQLSEKRMHGQFIRETTEKVDKEKRGSGYQEVI